MQSLTGRMGNPSLSTVAGLITDTVAPVSSNVLTTLPLTITSTVVLPPPPPPPPPHEAGIHCACGLPRPTNALPLNGMWHLDLTWPGILQHQHTGSVLDLWGLGTWSRNERVVWCCCGTEVECERLLRPFILQGTQL